MINQSLERYKGAGGVFPVSINCCQDTFFSAGDLEHANTFIKENKNKALYSTICTFQSENKTIANIENITAHFIDIDSHLITPTDEELAELANLILTEAHNKVIPVPSLIVNSGRGLHIYFNLKAGTTDIAKWQLTQRALQDKINAIVGTYNALYGVENLQLDKACCNANRQARITGTYNSKAGKYAKSIYHSNKRYSQEELLKDYELVYKDSKGKSIDLSKLTPADIINATQSQLKEFRNLYGAQGAQYTKETLRLARLQDLITLINARNARSVLTGYRENLLYIVAFILREKETSVESLYNDLLEYNKLFREPLSAPNIAKHAVYCLNSKQYYFSNAYIIDTLNITEAEQMLFKTIMSAKISKKKRNARYYSTGLYQITKDKNIKQRLEKQRRALELKEQGYNNNQIAKAMGYDRSTIGRWLGK